MKTNETNETQTNTNKWKHSIAHSVVRQQEVAFKITSNSEAQVTSSNKAMGIPNRRSLFFRYHRHWLCCFFQESFMSAYAIEKDKLEDTGVYVTMDHCKWCSDIPLAHLQTKQRDKEQQCHCNQIKCVLSTDISRKNRPEHYLENTAKTAKIIKTHRSVGVCGSWQSFNRAFDEPAFLSIHEQWAFSHAFSLNTELTILPNSFLM